MTLRYDPDRALYQGERLAVSVELFNRARSELIGCGMSVEEAVAALLHEEDWSPEMAGVEAIDRKEWPATLWFDASVQRFVGARLSVAVSEFYRRVRRLTATGISWSDACSWLRQEHEWTLDMAGVESAFAFDDVVAEAERLITSEVQA